MYWYADSCKTGSCADNEVCRSIDGLGKVECDPITTVPPVTTAPEKCEANPCCESSPRENWLCCQNGVCSNDNFVFNATTNNINECACLCTDNFSG